MNKGLKKIMTEKPGRNDPCPCGSGKKFKQCCLLKKQKGLKGMNVKWLSKPQEKAPPQEVLVRFTVIPFNVTYIVTVHFPSPRDGQ